MTPALRSRSAIALGIIALAAFIGLQLVGHRHASTTFDDGAAIAAPSDAAHDGSDHECGACAIAGVTAPVDPPRIADPRSVDDTVAAAVATDHVAIAPLRYAPKTSPPAHA